MRTVKLLATIGLWALQILLATAFVLIGVAKFGDASWARNFARWGYPNGFYMVIGVLEALGGLSLLMPRAASYGALLLGVIMIGASLTHFVHGESSRVVPPLLYVALLAIVGIARRERALRPPARQAAAAELDPM
jgi:uncharacterized membrane protein YphA (DoxX/SURF4 family)